MKLFFLKRKKLSVCLCLLAAAAMFAAVNSPAIVGAAAAQRQLPIYCVQRDQKMVSLSFDAAWGNEDTEQLIEILDKYQVKATFFVVGEWVDKYPESVKALHDAGHEVMNHSDDHAHFTKLSRQEMQENISRCSDKIEAVTGARPTLFRPPYGEYDDNVVTATRDMGMEPIQWDVEPNDIDESVSSNEKKRHFIPCAFGICGNRGACRRQGGMPVEVNHTHPKYESQEDRVERLKDTRKNCMARIRALRGTPEKDT